MGKTASEYIWVRSHLRGDPIGNKQLFPFFERLPNKGAFAHF